MSVPENLKPRVRNLLAKAEDPAVTEHERESYVDKATELMAKYGIEEAHLADRDPQRDAIEQRVFLVAAPYALPKARMLQGVANAMRCFALRSVPPRGQSDGNQRVRVFGYTSDLARVELIHASLTVQLESGLLRTPPGRSYRNAWALGFARKVADRIEVAEKRAADSSSSAAGRSTELVLADRTQRVQQVARENSNRIQTARPTASNATGYRAGVAAGARADIGQTRLSGNRAAIT